MKIRKPLALVLILIILVGLLLLVRSCVMNSHAVIGNSTAAASSAIAKSTAPTAPMPSVSDLPVAQQTKEAQATAGAGGITFTVGTPGSFAIKISGSAGARFSETGDLPPGVTLDPKTGLLSGTPAEGSGGSYPITITITNADGSIVKQNFTLTVNQAPTITSGGSATFMVGASGSFTVIANGYPAPSYSQFGLLPSGVTFNSTTGELSGKPAGGTGGSYPITISASNGIGSDAVEHFTLKVNQAPNITSGGSTAFTVGSRGSYTMKATGYPAPGFSATGELPDGVALNKTTGVLSGKPTAGTGGTYTITVKASNGIGDDSTKKFKLTVNQAPSIICNNSYTCTAGTGGSFTVNTMGYPTPAIMQTATLPSGVTFADNGDGTGTLTIGDSAAQGTYSLGFTASNGVGTDASQSFTLTVNHAPAITSNNSYTCIAGTGGTFTVSTTGYPTPAILQTATLPSGVTFADNSGGTGTLTVDASTTQGTYSLGFTASNGVGSDATQSFTLMVNQAPAFTSGSSTTFTAGTPGSFTVTATGCPAPTFRKTSGTLPSGVTLNATTGELSGTPSAGTAGFYMFHITASNGINPDATQSFTLTVNHTLAITSSNSYTCIAGTGGSFTVIATGYPAPAITQTATLPSGMTFADNGDGTGTLTVGDTAAQGTYSLGFTASNGVGTDVSQSFTLTVNQAPAFTSGSSTTFTAGIPGSFTVTATGCPAPTFRKTSGTLPSGVTLNATTGELSGTPSDGTAGFYMFRITASNGIKPDATQSFTLTVNQTPAITSANNYTCLAGTGGSFTVNTTGFPVPAINKTGALPSGMTFADNGDGTASLTVDAFAAQGTYSLGFTASNGVGTDASQSFMLTVNHAPAITSSNSYTCIAGTGGTFSVSTTGYPTPTIIQTATLPSGVTFADNGDGTGTLTVDASTTQGTYTLGFTSSNGVGTDAWQSFTLTVNQAPVITSNNSYTCTAGTGGSFTVNTTGYPTPIIIQTATLPSGVTFADNSDGTGTLTVDASTTQGTYSLGFTASNGVGTDASQSFTLTVNQAPAFTSGSSTTFTAGTPGSFTVTATGCPAPTFRKTSGTLPSGVTLNSATGELSGTPSAGTAGFYMFHITASNGINPDATQSFTLTVNHAPAITSNNNYTCTAGNGGSFTVNTTGYPTPTITQTETLPSGVTFADNGDGTATLTVGTSAAADTTSVSLTASNGVGSDATQSFTLTVGTAPAITSDNSFTCIAGTDAEFTVTTTGYPIPSITQSDALANGISFHDNKDGTATLKISRIAAANSYALSFTASNGIGSAATQSFVLTVGIAPAITSNNSYTCSAGIGGSFTVKTTGYPTPVVTQTANLPSGVTFADNGDGTATLTVGASTAKGTYNLDFTAANGVGTDAAQSFTLTVNHATAITSDNSYTCTAGTGGSFTVNTTGYPTPAITQTETLPSGVTFADNSDGTATLTVGASTAQGTYTLGFAASNGVGTDASQSFTLTVNRVPAITSADSYTCTAGTGGSFTVNTTGCPTPAITQTATLPSGVTFADNGDGTATLTIGAATTQGTYTLDFTAANGVGTDATQSFTLIVNHAPAITSNNSYTCTAGTGGSFTVKTTGYPTPAITQTETLPSGVTFEDNGDGTGTLTVGAATAQGTYTLGIAASNGVGTDAAQSFTLTVNHTPAITSDNSYTCTAGTGGFFTVNTTGYPTPAITQTETLPSGVTFEDNGDGTATLTVGAAAAQGTYTLDFTAANGVGTDATQSFTLTVNHAPAITSDSNYTCTAGTGGSFTVSTTGYPTPVVTQTQTLPSGVTFEDNDDGTGTLTVGAAATQGTYSLGFTASNGVGTDATQSFTLSVNRAPAITSADSYTCIAGTGGSFTVTASGYPVPSITKSGTLPSGVTFTDNGDGTAALNVSNTALAGTTSLDFKAANGYGSDAVQSFTLIIGTSPAITTDNSYLCIAGTGGNFIVETSGYPTPAITNTGTLPSGVTLTDNGNGTATLSVGSTAASDRYTLHFAAANGVGLDSTQSFTLTVGTAPAITSASSAAFTAESYDSFTVSSTGYPARTYGETGFLPSGITLNSTTGALSGTPAAGTGGTYPITISATNGVGTDASQSFTLTVYESPAITSATSASLTVGASGLFTVTSTGYPARMYSETGTLPSGVTLNAATGALSGTPAAGTGGTYPITLTATNGVGTDASQSFTLTVNQAPAITSSTGATFTAGASGSFTVTSTGYPARTYSETGTLPSGVTLNATTGALSGTPAGGTCGTYPITITASNGISTDASQSFTLTVISPAPTELCAATSDATHIVLTMSSALTGTTGAPAAFTIGGVASSASVTAVAVSGTTVTLTLSSAVVSSDNPTVTYSHTGTNDLTNGSLVANFGPAAVTNTVPPAAPTIVSAEAINNLHIVLTMSSALTGTTGDPAAFTFVNVGATVTAVAVSGTTVTLTLSSNVTEVDDNKYIVYTRTGTNDLTNGSLVANSSLKFKTTGFLILNAEVYDNHIFISMSDVLQGTTVDPAAFTLTCTNSPITVTSVSVTGYKLTLVLSRSVVGGEVRGLSYHATGTNDMKSGKYVADFSNAPVQLYINNDNQ